jgi:RNA polymerase sigma factor (sigma-70 family)
MTEKQEAFLQLYEPIHDRFERFCRARVYGDMDFRDLINDSLLIAFEKFETLRSQQAFLSFLCGISIRIIGNHHQKKKTERFQASDVVSDILDVNANPQAAADVHYLHRALAQLPEEQRECIILFEIVGFSIKEIVEIQGASESAVKQRLKRGREKLTEILTFEAVVTTGEQDHG